MEQGPQFSWNTEHGEEGHTCMMVNCGQMPVRLKLSPLPSWCEPTISRWKILKQNWPFLMLLGFMLGLAVATLIFL